MFLFRFNCIVCNYLYFLLLMESHGTYCLVSLTCVILACSQEPGLRPAEEKASQFGFVGRLQHRVWAVGYFLSQGRQPHPERVRSISRGEGAKALNI